MLVLTRKPGEEVWIDGRICVRVIQGGNGRIRLGIEAPREVSVVRGELLDSMQNTPVREVRPPARTGAVGTLAR